MNATADPPETEHPASPPAVDVLVANAFLKRWLAEYIRKRRSFLRDTGLATGIAAAAGAAAFFCAADVTLRLPSWLRWILLSFCLLLFLGSLISGLRAAAQVKRRVALDEIEAMIPDQGQLLRTALDESGAGVSGQPMRELLRQGLIREASRIAQGFKPEKRIPWNRLRWRWLAAAAAVGLCAGLPGVWSDFQTALRRLANPGGGLTFTRLAFVNPPDFFIAGREASVEVKVEGRRAGAPVLSIGRPGQPEDLVEMTPRDGTGGTVFTAALGKPETPLTLLAKAGDGSTGALMVPVLFPSKVLKMEAELKFPAYTGLPPARQNSPDFEAVEGTLATFTVTTDRPLEQGRVVFSDGKDSPLKLSGCDLSFQTPVRKGEISWSLEAADSHGLKLEGAAGKWRGLEDQPPRIEWVSPKKDMEATPLAEVTIKAKASDDFGLLNTGLVIIAGGRERELKSEDYKDGVPVTAVIEAVAALEKENLSIRDNVKVFAYARDRFPAPAGRERRGVSDLRNIDIRQFKVWRMLVEGRDGILDPTEHKAILKLEDLIRDQRAVVNAVFHMREENTAPSAICQAMSEKETAMAGGAAQLKAVMVELRMPKDDVLLLDTAAQQLGDAADTLKALDISGSWTNADGALSSLLELRKEFMKILVKGGGSKQGQPPDDDFKMPSLTQLAKEAERLAVEEEEIARAVPPSKDDPSEAGKLQARQAQAQADAGELFDTVVGHPEVTDLARSRMGEAEKEMTQAGLALRERRAAEAVPPLNAAAADLRLLARHLLGLEAKRAAETLKEAAQMAQKAAGELDPKKDPDKDQRTDGKAGEGSGKELAEDSKGKEAADHPVPEAGGGLPPDKQGKSGETGKGTAKGGSADTQDKALAKKGGAQNGDGQSQPGGGHSGQKDAAREAATIDDWLGSLAANETLGKTGGRLEALRKDLKVPGLSGRLEALAKGGEGVSPDKKELAEELGKLSAALMAEHDRMVEGMLEKLANAQAAAKALGNKNSGSADSQNPTTSTPAPAPGGGAAKGQGPGAEGQGKADPSRNPVMPSTQDLADRLEELNDAELADLSQQLQPLKDPRYNKDLRDSTLAKIEARLETLIREVIQRQLRAGKSDRVPQEFEGLVENYFRRLSEDTGEAAAESEEDSGNPPSATPSRTPSGETTPPAR